MLNWSDPFSEPFDVERWSSVLVPYWRVVLEWVQVVQNDPLFDEELFVAYAVLDTVPEPITAEEATTRWRKFVVLLWMALDEWKGRQRQRRRAALARRPAGQSPQ